MHVTKYLHIKVKKDSKYNTSPCMTKGGLLQLDFASTDTKMITWAIFIMNTSVLLELTLLKCITH